MLYAEQPLHIDCDGKDCSVLYAGQPLRIDCDSRDCAVYAEQPLHIDCDSRDCPVLCMLIEKLALEMGLGPPTSESIMSVSRCPLKPVLGQAAPAPLTL